MFFLYIWCILNVCRFTMSIYFLISLSLLRVWYIFLYVHIILCISYYIRLIYFSFFLCNLYSCFYMCYCLCFLDMLIYNSLSNVSPYFRILIYFLICWFIFGICLIFIIFQCINLFICVLYCFQIMSLLGHNLLCSCSALLISIET